MTRSPVLSPPAGVARWSWLALAVAVALLSMVSAGWIGLSILHGASLLHESGVVTGLAMDARAGLFYPPLIGPAGYGGTRYGPGHILAQCALMRLGVPAVAAGHLLAVAAAAALWAGLYRLLRLAGTARAAAVGFPLLLLTSPATREAIASIRPDLIPAALNVWGLAAAVTALRSGRARRRLWALAVLLFAAALVFKITACYAAVTAAALLALRWPDGVAADPRAAVRESWRGTLPLAATGLLAAIGLLACNAGSGGRMWENFHACLTVNGMPRVTVVGWLDLLRTVFITNDWAGTLPLLLAAAMWLAGPWALKAGPSGIYLVVTLALLLPQYFTPGLGTNQLIDPHVAAVLVIGTYLGGRSAAPADRSSPDRTDRPWGWTVAVAAAAVLSLGQLCQRINLARPLYRRTDAIRRAVALAGPSATRGPILSDNAMVPVTLGLRPFLLDDFMFPAVCHAHPEAEADLDRRLDDRQFLAVVLRHDPDDLGLLGQGFIPHLRAHYDLVSHTKVWDNLWVYRPKPN